MQPPYTLQHRLEPSSIPSLLLTWILRWASLPNVSCHLAHCCGALHPRGTKAQRDSTLLHEMEQGGEDEMEQGGEEEMEQGGEDEMQGGAAGADGRTMFRRHQGLTEGHDDEIPALGWAQPNLFL